MFGSSAISRLEEKLDYETWVLEFLDEEFEPFPSDVGGIEIRPDGTRAVSASVSASISQGRVDNIIQNLFPLIFTSSYKAIDMQIEWILEEHENQGIIGRTPWRFSEKIDEIEDLIQNGQLQVPSIYDSDNSVFDRVFQLYKQLDGHRGTIVHDGDFQTSEDELEITDRGGTTYTFDTKELFGFAKAAVLTSKMLKSGHWSDDDERSLKTFVDYLDFVHGEGTYGVTPPWSPDIQIQAEPKNEAGDKFTVEIDEVRDASETYPEVEGFYLVAKGISDDEEVEEWRIPEENLPESGEITLTLNQDQWSTYRIN